MISNVVIGEVWICSGQSNMQAAARGAPAVKAIIPKAKNIRSFSVEKTVSLSEEANCEGEWIEQYPNSAVAFSFGYFLEEVANVPIGIIFTAWGSTSLEA